MYFICALLANGKCRGWRHHGSVDLFSGGRGRADHHERPGAHASLVVRVRLRLAPQVGLHAGPEERTEAAPAGNGARARPPDRPVLGSRARARGRSRAPRRARDRSRTTAPTAHCAHRGLLRLEFKCNLEHCTFLS